MVERNVEMLRATADAIQTHPSRYEQGTWQRVEECGTVGCVAGHAAWQAGWTQSSDLDSFMVRRDGNKGRSRDVSVVAREVLGLTQTEAQALFAGGWQPRGYDIDKHGRRALANRVAKALRGLADGASIAEVSNP